MKVYKVTDKEFRDFGRVLFEYDFTEFVAALEKCEAPSFCRMAKTLFSSCTSFGTRRLRRQKAEATLCGAWL